ncbi:MAG: hypothetical protein IKR76_06730, partial [Ruminococcus sp.]|nr:hypothetical protein [Ruminococcus sp.]
MGQVVRPNGRDRRGSGALVSTKLIPKAPERSAGQARELDFSEQRSGAIPSACFAGTSPKGRLVRLASLGSC